MENCAKYCLDPEPEPEPKSFPKSEQELQQVTVAQHLRLVVVGVAERLQISTTGRY